MSEQGWDERFRRQQEADMTPYRIEVRRLGEATRSVIERLVATRAPAEELARAADALEDVAATLASYPQGRLYEGFAESANAGTEVGFFDHSPMIGRANPLAPPIEVQTTDDLVIGRVCFGSAYEGPPGCVHGGYLAAAFDEVLGMAQSMSGRPGMTGSLTVRYRRPTPLHHDLVFEGRLISVSGRKISTQGRCLADGEVTAEADGLFISVDLAKMAELFEARSQAQQLREKG